MRKKRGMSDHPIGATWRATDDRGRIGTIYLAERNEFFEVWRWYVRWSDGSGTRGDWNTSYRLCLREIPIYNRDYKPVRFKRVPESEQVNP